MTSVALLARPQRWDTPFAREMTDADVAYLHEQPIIRDMDPERFPVHTPLEGILRNDCRIMRCGPGEIIVREGDYGNSAFLVLEGDVRITLQDHLPREVLGRAEDHTKNLFETVVE